MELYTLYFVFMLAGLFCIGLFVCLLMITFLNIVSDLLESEEKRNGNDC